MISGRPTTDDVPPTNAARRSPRKTRRGFARNSFPLLAIGAVAGLATLHGGIRIFTYEMKGEAPQGVVLGTFMCAGLCVLFVYLARRLKK